METKKERKGKCAMETKKERWGKGEEGARNK